MGDVQSHVTAAALGGGILRCGSGNCRRIRKGDLGRVNGNISGLTGTAGFNRDYGNSIGYAGECHSGGGIEGNAATLTTALLCRFGANLGVGSHVDNGRVEGDVASVAATGGIASNLAIGKSDCPRAGNSNLPSRIATASIALDHAIAKGNSPDAVYCHISSLSFAT